MDQHQCLRTRDRSHVRTIGLQTVRPSASASSVPRRLRNRDPARAGLSAIESCASHLASLRDFCGQSRGVHAHRGLPGSPWNGRMPGVRGSQDRHQLWLCHESHAQSRPLADSGRVEPSSVRLHGAWVGAASRSLDQLDVPLSAHLDAAITQRLEVRHGLPSLGTQQRPPFQLRLLGAMFPMELREQYPGSRRVPGASSTIPQVKRRSSKESCCSAHRNPKP